MQELIKHYFPLILTASSAICAIFLFFHGFGNSSQGIFSYIGHSVQIPEQKAIYSTVAQQTSTQSPAPIPIYEAGTLTVGNIYNFDCFFKIKLSNGDLLPITEAPHTALYLIDVIYPNGSSALSFLSSEDINSLEEIPSPAIYDKENHQLSFHKSGVYTLITRLHYAHRPGILFECPIPVEVG